MGEVDGVVAVAVGAWVFEPYYLNSTLKMIMVHLLQLLTVFFFHPLFPLFFFLTQSVMKISDQVFYTGVYLIDFATCLDVITRKSNF